MIDDCKLKNLQEWRLKLLIETGYNKGIYIKTNKYDIQVRNKRHEDWRFKDED